MKTIITIITTMTFFAVLVACQNKTGKDNKNTTNSSLASCEQSNSLKIEQYDFSKLLLDNRIKYIGYIGTDYQKMDISFDSIKKATNKEYLVWGKSKVKDNICDFKGHINIIAIHNYDTLEYGLDSCMKNNVIKQGDMIANYKFDENINQQGSGTFTGKLTAYWYINDKGLLLYDDISDYSDAYENNQYDGIWQSYKTKKTKKCAWGQYRIPNSGDLDIGAAEFSPNPKYYDKGWRREEYLNYINPQRKWYGDYSVEIYIPDEVPEKCTHKFNILFTEDECTYYHWGGASPEIRDCEMTEINDSIVSFFPINKDLLPQLEGKPLAQLFRKNGKYFIKGPFIYDKDYNMNVMIEVIKTEFSKLE